MQPRSQTPFHHSKVAWESDYLSARRREGLALELECNEPTLQHEFAVTSKVDRIKLIKVISGTLLAYSSGIEMISYNNYVRMPLTS